MAPLAGADSPNGIVDVRIVNGLSAETLCSVCARSWWTVCDLKAHIERSEGTPCLTQRLLVAGRHLRDEEIVGNLVLSTSGEGTAGNGSPAASSSVAEAAGAFSLEVALVRINAKWAAILRDCADGWVELKTASEELRNNPEVVTAAVTAAGAALQYASEEMRHDRSVVLAAVTSNGSALRYAAKELRCDREIVLAAVRGSALALRYASEELWHDREFTLRAVQVHGSALLYAPPELRRDREVVLAAVSNDPSALRHVPQALHYDPEIKQAAALSAALKAPATKVSGRSKVRASGGCASYADRPPQSGRILRHRARIR